MSGEDGVGGYVFQFNVILQVALESWGGIHDTDIAALLIEGEPGQDAVDYSILTKDRGHRILSQVKSRRTQRTFSAREIVQAIQALDHVAGTQQTRLEFVTNGLIGPTGQALIDLLGRSAELTDEQINRELLLSVGVGDLASPELASALRRTAITVRPAPLPELRAQVADGLSTLRARSGLPVGREAAEMLRSKLFELLLTKTEGRLSDRWLTREEFLSAARTPQRVLEDAHGSRWSTLTRIADQRHAVRRDELMRAIGQHLQDHDDLHGMTGTVAICVLSGRAGAGKTTLACRYALERAAEFNN